MKPTRLAIVIIFCLVASSSFGADEKPSPPNSESSKPSKPKEGEVQIRELLTALGFKVSDSGYYSITRVGGQVLYDVSHVEFSCTNQQSGAKLGLVSGLQPDPASKITHVVRADVWRVEAGDKPPEQDAALALAKRLSAKLHAACSDALKKSKEQGSEIKKVADGFLVKCKAGRIVSVESQPGPL